MTSKTRRMTVLAWMLGVLAIAGCWGGQPASEGSFPSGTELPAFGEIDPQQAADVISTLADEPGFVLLDIRTAAEIEAGHIAGADILDFYSPTFSDELAALDRDLTYLIYCRTGNRTGQTAVLMEQLGFERVYDLDGGITQWLASDLPVCLGSVDAAHSCTGTL